MPSASWPYFGKDGVIIGRPRTPGHRRTRRTTARGLAAHNLSVRPISDEDLRPSCWPALPRRSISPCPCWEWCRAGAGRAPVTSLATVTVEGQPLAANTTALSLPLNCSEHRCRLAEPSRQGWARRDSQALQQLLDSRVLLSVHINPESRVRGQRGPAPAPQEAGYTPAIVKVVNESGGTPRLRIGSRKRDRLCWHRAAVGRSHAAAAPS